MEEIDKWLKDLFDLAKEGKSAATTIKDEGLGMGRKKRRRTMHKARRAGSPTEKATKLRSVDWKKKKRSFRRKSTPSKPPARLNNIRKPKLRNDFLRPTM